MSKESVFSDLNNLKVITTTSEEYADKFGFTEAEVFAALDANGWSDRKREVKDWYDGFSFGSKKDIYNHGLFHNLSGYLENSVPTGRITSANSLADRLIREGSVWVKQDFDASSCGERASRYNWMRKSFMISLGKMKEQSGRCWRVVI